MAKPTVQGASLTYSISGSDEEEVILLGSSTEIAARAEMARYILEHYPEGGVLMRLREFQVGGDCEGKVQ